MWLQQREEAGLKFPNVRKLERRKSKTSAVAGAAPSDEDDESPASSPSPTTEDYDSDGSSDVLPDISNILLDGEDDNAVPIYDTCDEIRRKINGHLIRTPGLTEAEFRRALFAQLHKSKAKGIQVKQMSDFRAALGPRAGIKSSVFYAAYVYFEKLRLARGEHESGHREMMEYKYPDWYDRNVHSKSR